MPASRHRRQYGHQCSLLLLVLLMTGACFASAANWRWELPVSDYRKMSVFERAQYDKAAKAFRENNFRAAASEFEKFKIQFPDSEQIPYILFMIGYSLHNDKQRNSAIKVYNEVLDYFGDVINEGSAALYCMGVAHIENGDVRKGMLLLKEMVEDPDYHKHPLAAGALRRLADNEWRNKSAEAAVRYWRQVVRDFSESNREEAKVARDNVTAYYIKTADYTSYENWLVNEENAADVKHRKWVAQHAWHEAFHNFRHDWGKYTNFNREEKIADMQALYSYFKKQREWYDKDQDSWTFFHNALLFAAQRMRDRQETKAVLLDALPLVKDLKETGERNQRFAYLADRLREAEDFDQAIHCITFITDPPLASYKEYEVLAAKSIWDAAVKRLEDIEGMNNADWAVRALGERARIHKDVLRQYEKAIALYQQLNNPPHNLWAIQECYRNWGKLKEALAVLSEIENMFPDQAPNAAWRKAEYLDQSGDAAQAIAQARRILKVYPKSHASSQAHQLLERLGVDTGGGVGDNE